MKQDKAGMNKLDLGKLSQLTTQKKVSVKTNRQKSLMDYLIFITITNCYLIHLKMKNTKLLWMLFIII